MATIGFIGLGNMGAPMAANLVKAGHRVTGYDLNAEALRALAAAGGHTATSAAEAATGAEFVITSMLGRPASRSATSGCTRAA